MRLLIFANANDPSRFFAALAAPVDAIILDPLRDDATDKCAAIRAHRKFLGLLLPALSAPNSHDALQAALSLKPDFLLAPDIYGKADLQHRSLRLAALEAQLGMRDGSIRVVAHITADPAAVFALDQLGGPSRRLIGLLHDEAALAEALGVSLDHSAAAPLAYARGKALLAAARAKIRCYIALGAEWRDEQAEIYAKENFAGALLVDPDHVAPAQKIFGVRKS